MLDVKDISDALVVADSVIPQTDITISPLEKNNFFDSIDLRSSHYLSHVYRHQISTNQALTLIEELVSQYTQYDDDETSSTLASRYGEVVDALETLSYDDIEVVFKAVSEKGPEYR